MMNLLTKLTIYVLGVFVAGYILANGVKFDSIVDYLVLGLVLFVLNHTVRPILKFLTFPITLLTLGLFSLIINLLIVLIADTLLGSFKFENIWWAFLFSILFSIITSVFSAFENQTHKNNIRR